MGMLTIDNTDAYKSLLRDFLVQTTQFQTADNADLFAEDVAAAQKVL